MTERMAIYMGILDKIGLITRFISGFMFSVMLVWFFLRNSPVPTLRKLSGVPFWTCILILYLGLFIGLVFFVPRN